MKLLLDTHALLWWLLRDRRLSGTAFALLTHKDTVIVVSSVSGWEIATKHRLGKLPVPEILARDLHAVAVQQGWRTLPVTMVHAQVAGRLPGSHKDPFDRMLAAQSLIEDVPLVSNDGAFAGFGNKIFW